jgi:hypothetical protein
MRSIYHYGSTAQNLPSEPEEKPKIKAEIENKLTKENHKENWTIKSCLKLQLVPLKQSFKVELYN